MNYAKKLREKGIKSGFNALSYRINRISNMLFMKKNLAHLLDDCNKKIQKLDISEIRDNTLAYIERMRIKERPYGQYTYCESQKHLILYASIYAVLTRHLYRDLDLTENQRQGWIEYIKSFQDGYGLFKDPNINNEIAINSDW